MRRPITEVDKRVDEMWSKASKREKQVLCPESALLDLPAYL